MHHFKLYSSIFAPFFAILVSACLFSGNTEADEPLQDKNAKISDQIGIETVDRRMVLIDFFNKYQSPLVNNVDTFINVADKYGLDYRLLPAISCMESTCGKHMPYNSFNAWGWGVYGNNVIRFKNFDDAIEVVGKGIYEGYMKRGLDTPQKMAPVYTPPKAGHWLNGVTKFISQMEEIADNHENS